MSLSLMCYASGLAYLIIAFLYFWIEMCQFWTGELLFWPGLNPMYIMIGATLTRRVWPFGWYTWTYNSTKFFKMNVWGTMMWLLISMYLYEASEFYYL